jgi:pyruvate carboxylase
MWACKRKPEYAPLDLPKPFKGELKAGTKQILDSKGPEALAEWVRDQKEVLIMDTTFRDAHQSLFATRLRTLDMLRVMRGHRRQTAGDVRL